MPDSKDSLIDALRARAPGALERAYRTHRVSLFGFLVRLCGNRDIASDLFQNTWIKLARHAPRLRPDTNLKAWLFTVARNEYRSFRRWQYLDPSRLLTLSQARNTRDLAFGEPSALLSSVETALSLLPVAEREVLLLVYVEEVDSAEAAVILGITPPALRKRLSRARQKLQALLNALDNAPLRTHPKERDTSHGPAI